MRPQVKLILQNWRTTEDFDALKSRLLRLEPHIPLLPDELEEAQAIFKVWLLKLDAKGMH